MRTLPIIAVVLLLSCASLRSGGVSMTELLPRETEIPGWQLSDAGSHDSGELTPDERASGAEEKVSALYCSMSRGKRTAGVEILRFGSALEAFGLFSIERSSLKDIKRNGPDYAAASDAIIFRLGRFYIRIRIQPDKKSARADYSADADFFYGIIRDRLESMGGSDAMPEAAYLFSAAGDYSDLIYFRRGDPLLPQLDRVYARPKELRGRIRRVYYSDRNSAMEAQSLFASILSGASSGFTLARSGPVPVAFRKLPGGGILCISFHRQWIFGLFDADDIDEVSGLLDELAACIIRSAP
jgi:hypothetical protein